MEVKKGWGWLAVLAIASAGCDSGTAPPADDPAYCQKAKCADDGDPCTDDCNEATDKCAHTAKPAGTACDDGDACTEGDKCPATGKCAGSSAKKCDDGNPCTTDSCDPKSGCVNTPASGPCNADDDVCTVGDKCSSEGKCLPGAKKDCDDGNPCTTDTCDPVDGCKNKPNSDPCDDNDACTEKDKCVDKSCKGAAVATDDDNPCTTDACTPSGGVTHAANTADCDDKNPCTVGDKCSDKKCAPGAAKTCDDNNPCTDDSCDAASGDCKHANNSVACDDGSACTKDDTCDAGACKGAAVKIDDGNPCTDDDCDKKGGVSHVANTAPCDDGKVCTLGDKCADKACVSGVAKICDEIDGNPCTEPQCLEGAGGCKEVKVKDDTPCTDNDKCTDGDKCGGGVCLPGAPTTCNGDGNVCKDWGCDPKIGCTFKPAQKGKNCDDGNACTQSDTCDTGACLPGPSVACQDGKPCTDDSCNPKTGCVYAPNSQPCDDKDACTVGDQCKDGACSPGTVTTCDDKNPCTIDQCDKATGKCGTQAATDGTPCEDASLCTSDTVCKTGQCGGGTKVICKDDGNPCTSDACADATGCKYPAQDGPCDADGSVCTPNDYCSAGKCLADSIKSCDDGNPCTDDVCDKLKDCLHTNNTAPCDDKLLCTENDKCKGGTCSDTTPKNCSDGNDCTDDSCDNKTGCGNVNSLAGSVCSDGDACSTGDSCDGQGACKAVGKALWITTDGTALQEELHGVVPGPDGSFVAAGHRFVAPGSAKGLVRKVDVAGKTVFEVLTSPAGSASTHLNDIVAVAGGAYMAVGTVTNYNFHAMKVTATGAVLWEKGFSGSAQTEFRDAVALPAGKSAMVAAVGYDSGGGARVVEIDPNGNELNNFLLKSPSGGTTLDGRAIAWSPAVDYWVAGQYGLPSGQYVVRMFRVQYGTGNIIKEFNVAPTYNDALLERLVADDAGVIGVGRAQPGPNGGKDGWIARIDNTYNLVGEQFAGDTEQDFLVDVQPLSDGGWLTVGFGYAGFKSNHGIWARFDKNLGPVWKRLFYGTALGVAGTAAGGSTYIRAVTMTSAGRIAIVGDTAVASKGENDLLYATCDIYGNCDCASSGTCISKTIADCDDKNPCTLDWCDKGTCQHAIGNEAMTCGTNQTCQKGKCL